MPAPRAKRLGAGPARTGPARIGTWSAALTAVCAAAPLTLGVTTPPRSGPNCRSDCITYPYTDGAAFVPRDYRWMCPVALLALVFVALAVCIHGDAEEDRKGRSLIGVACAAVAAGLLTVAYVVQLAVVQPSLLKGETEGLSLVSQYNPHGVFIAFEDLGYALMSVAFLFCGAALVGRGRLEG